MRYTRLATRACPVPAWAALALLLAGCALVEPAPKTRPGSAAPDTAAAAPPDTAEAGTADGAEAPADDEAAAAGSQRIALLRPPGHEAEIRRHRERLAGTAPEPLPATEAGYYMDLQEANLRQHLGDTGARIARRSDRIVVLLAAAPGFDTGEVEPDASLVRLLDAVAGVVAQYPATLVAVHSYTDPSGAAELNQRLSEQRAVRVARRLTEAGIPIDHIVALGHGESHLATDDMAPEDRPPNRRIEIHLQPITGSVKSGGREHATRAARGPACALPASRAHTV